MKTKKSDLEIDSIGGIGYLTIEEEKALSDFFKKKKTTEKTLKKKEINT
ncbi:MAG: hypothetical protein I4O51_10360 [Flavobacterium micromati]|nr:hypothetical protein [Flavobacterium micromati]